MDSEHTLPTPPTVETFRDGPFRWIKREGYKILLIGEDPDPIADNVDVEVHLEDGRRYGATLFTLENLRRLQANNEDTGGWVRDLYFWCPDMVIVRDLRPETIAAMVSDLIRRRDLDRAFLRYADGDSGEAV